MASDTGASDAESKPKGRGVLGAVIASVLALALGGAHGVTSAIWFPTWFANDKANGQNPAEKAVALVVRDLAPVVTNLAGPPDVWIRLEGGVVIDAAAAKQADVLMTQISGDILAFLRTVSLKQLQGANGLAFLREDLNERARQRSGGAVREIILHTLVAQ